MAGLFKGEIPKSERTEIPQHYNLQYFWKAFVIQNLRCYAGVVVKTWWHLEGAYIDESTQLDV